jgi:purine-binding chemotaxis protein CheW
VNASVTLHVVFRIGPAEYVLPASIVAELDTFVGVTPVPGAAAHVLGLVHVRTRVLPLVDLRIRFGLPPGERGTDQRVMVIEHAGRRIGLLVDSAREVTRIEASAFADPPELVVLRTAGFVKKVAQIGTRLVMLLDCDRVLQQESADDRLPAP